MYFIMGLSIAQWAGFCLPGHALEPEEILVLANRNAAHSVGLAKYYMEKRGIPEDHLLVLRATDKEWCDRGEYESRVAVPVRKYLGERDAKRQIRCLLVMYGLPLRVSAPAPRIHERGKEELKNPEQSASLDSEIALVLEEAYPLSRWVPNPFFVGHQGRYVEQMPDKGEVLMVSRLDGPNPEIVRRIIDDSIETEKRGLKGVAYLDARWPRPKNDEKKEVGMGYEFYDRSIHLAAERLTKSGRMPVVVNDKAELFQPGECPDAALYCGWYSLAHYVDAFKWRAGSIGYHIASAECQTLKQAGSQVWCKRMLEEGVAATIGPVGEPYVQAFPVPEIFFGLLVDGYWTLAECYALSQPFWSWQMVLIGDPLYRPFRQP
jgi:uncharacterized protein (TIGR03790 family)